MVKTAFTEHAHRALLSGERAGAVCSFCGTTLPSDYYLLLSAWRSKTQELVSPRMRFCAKCWDLLEDLVSAQVSQLRLPLEAKEGYSDKV